MNPGDPPRRRGDADRTTPAGHRSRTRPTVRTPEGVRTAVAGARRSSVEQHQHWKAQTPQKNATVTIIVKWSFTAERRRNLQSPNASSHTKKHTRCSLHLCNRNELATKIKGIMPAPTETRNTNAPRSRTRTRSGFRELRCFYCLLGKLRSH